MNKELIPLIDEAIKLENNMSVFYKSLANVFLQDAFFWKQLASEELEHAAIIRAGKEYFLPFGQFPEQILCENLETLETLNSSIEGLIGQVENKILSREECFQISIGLEYSAGEAQFDQALVGKDNSKALDIIRSMIQGCRNHADRIEAYQKNNPKN